MTTIFGIIAAPGLLVLAYYALLYFQRAWSIVVFPYGYDYGESPELERAIDVARGRPIYTGWLHPPYHMANYPPLFPLINGVFVHFLGVQYQSGRLIEWISSLLFCLILAWLAWREAHSVFAPITTVLFWFSVHYVWNWTPLNREDELAILLSGLGLLVFMERYVYPIAKGRQRSDWAVWLAMLLFLGAIYTRQTTIEAAVACGAYLLFTRPRFALVWAGVFAFIAGLLFGIIDLLTKGYFFLNIVIGNLNIFQWSRVLFFGRQFWDYYQVGVILAVFFLLTQIVLRRQQVFLVWFLMTFAVAITVGKVGAAENYLLLPWGAVSLCVGSAVGRLHNAASWLWTRRRIPLLPRVAAVMITVPVGFLVLLHAQLAFHLLYSGRWTRYEFEVKPPHGVDTLLVKATRTGWYLRLLPNEVGPQTLLTEFGYRYKPEAANSLLREDQYLVKIVHQAKGPVFDEDMTHLLMAGREIYIQPFEFTQEAELGRWNQAPFLEAIRSQQFPIVISTIELTRATHFERYTPQMLEAFSTSYCLNQHLTYYYVYTPCKQ